MSEPTSVERRRRAQPLTPLQRAFLALEQTRAQLRARAGRARASRSRSSASAAGFPAAATIRRASGGCCATASTRSAPVPRDRWDVDALYDPDPDAPGKIATRVGRLPRSRRPVRSGVLRHRAARGARHGSAAAAAARGRVGGARARRASARTVSSAARPACSSASRGSDYAYLQLRRRRPHAARRALRVGHRAQRRGRPALVSARPAGAESDDRHRVLVVARRGAPRVSGAARGRLPHGARRRREPDALARALHRAVAGAHARRRTAAARRSTPRRTASRAAKAAAWSCSSGLRDAQADGDRILAVIRGSGGESGRAEQRAHRAERPGAGSGDPRGAARAAASRRSDVGYIEAHGTGTALGDPIEVRALGAVFGARRDARTPLVRRLGQDEHRASRGGGRHRGAHQGRARRCSIARSRRTCTSRRRARTSRGTAAARRSDRARRAWHADRRAAHRRRQLVRLQRHQRARRRRGSAAARGGGRGGSR